MSRSTKRFLCFCLIAAFSGTAQSAEPTPDEQTAFFEKRVRPVLAAKCFSCHGEKKQELGIRLDSRQSVIDGGDGGEIVVAGKPEESVLIAAVRRDGILPMPPDDPLSPEEIAALTRWVELGLPWPNDHKRAISEDQQAYKTHWAFQPIADPELPEVKDQSWARGAIDRFILARLEEAGLTPSPEASKLTLIRRATFDLLGLPPTPEEVEAFERDQSQQAYEKLIDRLLASPHYGERWGRHWLDVARYADNKGYIFFGEKEYPWAFTYRDYVVRALNEDLPIDRFITEQLAADQLDLADDPSALPAMGFLTLGARFSGNVHDIIDDRIDVVTRGLMGLTVTCARCHDHKFDPVAMTDYYGLYGVFRSSSEPTIPPVFEKPPATERYQNFAKELEACTEKLNEFTKEKHSELVTSARTRAAEYLMAAHAKRHQPPTEDFMLLVEAGDLNPTMIQRWQTYLTRAKREHDPIWAIWHACAELDEAHFAEQAEKVIATFANGEQTSHPAILAAMQGSPPASMAEMAERYSKTLNEVDQKWQAELKQAAEAHAAAPVGFPDPAEEALRRVFYGSQAPPDVPVLTGWGFLTLLPDRPAQNKYKELLGEVQKQLSQTNGLPARAMVMTDAEELYDPKVFLRGNPNRPGAAAPRGFLRFLAEGDAAEFQNGSGRLELARAITDPDNPLTARVFVNRVWIQHFGRGLVTTPSDFGLRSEPPTHPLLLDHLAREFMRDGWSLKRLHRRIMLSAAYRQQSLKRTAGAKVDPQNRLLWRMNRRRLDFESLRDSLLAVTGEMDQTLGGPPVKIHQVVWSPRRTIYAFVDRMDLPELFRAFDFPDPAATSPARDSTTIAPQALYLMNHKFMPQVTKRVMAREDVQGEASDAGRVERLYKICYGRSPSRMETRLSLRFLGEKPSEERWRQFVQALLMTNEFAFVD